MMSQSISLLVLSVSLSLLVFTTQERLLCHAFLVHQHQQQHRQPLSSSSSSSSSLRIPCQPPLLQIRVRKGRMKMNGSNDDVEESTKEPLSSSSSSSYKVRVEYEGHDCYVEVHRGETLLAALERENVSQKLALPLSMIPHDCRRGNCLSCAARHAPASQVSSVIPTLTPPSPSPIGQKQNQKRKQQTKTMGTKKIVRDGPSNGLSPFMSDEILQRGYVLTCSSIVVGDGLHLRLSEQDQVWSDMYQQRFVQDKSLEVEAWAAMARQRRIGDERNVPRWTKETEAVLTEGSNDSTGENSNSNINGSGEEN